MKLVFPCKSCGTSLRPHPLTLALAMAAARITRQKIPLKLMRNKGLEFASKEDLMFLYWRQANGTLDNDGSLTRSYG